MADLISKKAAEEILLKVTDMLGNIRSKNRRPMPYEGQNGHGSMLTQIETISADMIVNLVENTQIPEDKYQEVIQVITARLDKLTMTV